jgi:hypothetical protein
MSAAWGHSDLSGEPQQPVAQPQAHPQQPVQGGWQQPWQDETGQWHYPWAAQQPPVQPPYPGAQHALVEPQPVWDVPPAPAPMPAAAVPAVPVEQPIVEQTFVAPEQLAPVGPPRYAAPVRVAQDPRQKALAAVITFVCLIVALWAILGFTGSLAKTLSSIASGNQKLKIQLKTANEGLVQLDQKTSKLDAMASDSKQLKGLLGTIDGDMGTMLTSVDGIATSMTAMNKSVTTLDDEITRVNTINGRMADQLGHINTGLGDQVKSVRTMRRDVQATGVVLRDMPGRLQATNDRLAFVNGNVNTMGCLGIINKLNVHLSFLGIPNGTAEIQATTIPQGAWGVLADGRTQCPLR